MTFGSLVGNSTSAAFTRWNSRRPERAKDQPSRLKRTAERGDYLRERVPPASPQIESLDDFTVPWHPKNA